MTRDDCYADETCDDPEAHDGDDLLAAIDSLGLGREYRALKAKLAAMEDARTFWVAGRCSLEHCGKAAVGKDSKHRCMVAIANANPDGMSMERLAHYLGISPQGAEHVVNVAIRKLERGRRKCLDFVAQRGHRLDKFHKRMDAAIARARITHRDHIAA